MNKTHNNDAVLTHEILNQQAFWQSLENALLLGVQSYDQTGRLIYVNQVFLDMVQFDKNELLNKMIEDCPYIPADEHQNAILFKNHMLQFQDEMKSREGTHKRVFEGKFVRKDGTIFEGKMLANSIFNPDGKYIGWVKTIEDVTEINRLNAFRQKEEKRLEALHKILSLGEITSAISHELNQPLTALSSYAVALINMINSDTHRLTKQSLIEIAQKIHQQAERASNVTRRVRQFLLKSQDSRVLIKVGELLSHAIELIELELSKNKCEVRLNESEALGLEVWVDKLMLEQSIINVIHNVIEEMNDADIKHKLIQIHVRVHDEKNVLISICDNGRGVPVAVKDKIFDLFFSSKPNGAGIGLNICRTVLEANGGRMWAESNNHGGEFCLSLPIYTHEDNN